MIVLGSLAAIISARAANIHFQPDHGFFSNTFPVTISPASANAEIWFTLNGDVPARGAFASQRYTAPFVISNTVTIRAAAFSPEEKQRDVETRTFISLGATVRQSVNPAGFPELWRGIKADYEMDQDVIASALPPYDITKALLSLPAISLVAPLEDIFGASRGIYFNSMNEGPDWEREASIELIFPDGTRGFQTEAGLRIHGYSSRGHGFTRKHSFHLNFREKYGAAKLHFQLFPDCAVTDFDQIVLRACSTDSFPCYDINLGRWDPRRASYIRDQWMRDAIRDLDHPTAHGRYVHLWLNGLYWGLYNLAELPGAGFAASHFGGKKKDYDVLKDYLIADGGDARMWKELQTLVASGVTTETLYQRIQGNNPGGTRNINFAVYLNLTNFVDFMLLHITAGAEDFPNNNWWSCRRRGADSDGFCFVPWDQEISNESLTRTTNPWGERFEEVKTIDRPGYFYDRMRGYGNFRQLFMDRAWFALTGSGPLAPESNAARWLARQNEIDRAIVAESARWGDSSHIPASTRTSWLNEMNFVAGYWASNQVRAIQRFRNVGLWPVLAPPALSRFTNNQTFAITHTNGSGGIWFTQDRSDPRAPNGKPSASSRRYSSALTLTNSTFIRARIMDGENWSPPLEAVIRAPEKPIRGLAR